MKRLLILSLGAVLAVGLIVQTAGASSGGKKVLEFDTMVGVSGPFVGSSNPIRGVNGGGLPWQIAKGKGELASDGRLEVKVRGLVLLDGPPVPPALPGDEPHLVVSGDRELPDHRRWQSDHHERGDRSLPGNRDRGVRDRGDRDAAPSVPRPDHLRRALLDDVVLRHGRIVRTH